jgi:hypothetical protein
MKCDCSLSERYGPWRCRVAACNVAQPQCPARRRCHFRGHDYGLHVARRIVRCRDRGDRVRPGRSAHARGAGTRQSSSLRNTAPSTARLNFNTARRKLYIQFGAVLVCDACHRSTPAVAVAKGGIMKRTGRGLRLCSQRRACASMSSRDSVPVRSGSAACVSSAAVAGSWSFRAVFAVPLVIDIG